VKIRLLNNEQGSFIIEALIMSGLLVFVILTSISTISYYENLDREINSSERSLDSVAMVLAPILNSPRYAIENMCTSKAAWSGRTSSCDSLDFSTTPAQNLEITQSGIQPYFASILGQDLKRVRMNIFDELRCLDLVRCRYKVSDSIIEMIFEYSYQKNMASKVRSRRLSIMVGSRG
jgi:hypothetical protein